MARAVPWRDLCPPEVRALQQLCALRPLWLLRQAGPVAFTVQDSDNPPVQVRLGDPHHCSCKAHLRSKDLCLHLCWVLLKKLQLKPHNPLSYQLGLVDRELSDLLEPRREVRVALPRRPARLPEQDNSVVPRRKILAEDVCPICLLRFQDSKLPVVHCRHSCGNAVHTRCMLQVARHQLHSNDVTTERLLTCPLCRGPFCRGKELAEAARRREGPGPGHRTRALSPVPTHDVTCVLCRVSPVVGNLYRCLQCSQVVVCAQCISSPQFTDLHATHGYAIKKAKWETVRPPHWTPPQPPPPPPRTLAKQSLPSNHQTTGAENSLAPRECAFCGLEFKNKDQWAGRWKDYWLHMSCLESWRADPLGICGTRRGPASGLPMIDLATLLGPPEVRVVRLSLSTRPPQEGPRGPGGEQPRPPRPPRQPVSPLRGRPRRTKKKKTQKTQTNIDIDDNKLPMSVTLGRALGAQVQPLMAVLMSPRVRTVSLGSESGEGENSDDEDKSSSKPKTPLLTITSLELPELMPARKPQCLPVRRVRTSVLRSRPAKCACVQPTQTQNIACAGLALPAKK